MSINENESDLHMLSNRFDEVSYKIQRKILIMQEPDVDVVSELFLILDEIYLLLYDKDYMPIKLAGKMFYLYVQIEAEASYKKDHTSSIFKLLAKMQSRLSEIFDRKGK